MDIMNLMNRPQNNLKPAAGRLLIAEPFLSDPNFSRAVVFICEHGDEGTVGFVLNHSTDLVLGDLLPELYSTQELMVYQGGPVQMDTLHMLHRMPVAFGGNEISPGVYWGGSYEALQDVITQNCYQAGDIRLFVGYSGWSPGQLEKELEEGSWIVAEANDEILFEPDPKNIWKHAIQLLGREYSFMQNLPVNPLLN